MDTSRKTINEVGFLPLFKNYIPGFSLEQLLYDEGLDVDIQDRSHFV